MAEVAREGDAAGEGERGAAGGERKPARIVVPATGDQYAWTAVATQPSGVEAGLHDLTLVLHGRIHLAAFRFDSNRANG
ncbi:hypothetical protein [Streptomyces camelliae]|uniref:Uncharacterized protein n=1 Tax=Streptomyces camelliae TaxID=3004093 RepID=A0ABY7NTV1_9ACTN|nr:hypothetical protein [Streptomyces sp. HUAS 2-6]WBO61597.1 hypothetical protein O1G22_01320 [Streptomyces sp. HUAS 2-6]